MRRQTAGRVSSVPPIAAATADLAIVRFHGRDADAWQAKGVSASQRFAYEYDASELAEWVPKIGALHEEGRRVHLLMNNCHDGMAVRCAGRLAQLLVETRSDHGQQSFRRSRPSGRRPKGEVPSRPAQAGGVGRRPLARA